MGTSQEILKDATDKNVGRLLKDGSNGSLARAKETLKDRLYQQMIEELQDELEATDEVAQQALEQSSVDWDAVMEDAKEALKKELMASMIQQALEEVNQELEATDEIVEALMEEAPAPPEALNRIKKGIKERLMEEMLQEAIAEIHDEVGSSDESVSQPDAFEPELADELDVAEEDEASDSSIEAQDEPVTIPDDTMPDLDGQPLIDMHYWNEENNDEEDTTSEPVESVMEASEELDIDPDFFPQEVEIEPGESFGDGLSAEPVADGTPISFLAGFSLNEESLEDSGDGAPNSMEVTDFNDESESEEKESEPDESEAYLVYGVFPTDAIFDESNLPITGIDPDSPLFAITAGELGAIVSGVSDEMFGEEALAQNMKDAQWKEATLLAYEGLVEDCATINGFVPVPFASVYTSQERVQQALLQAESFEMMTRVQDRKDWTVRVYRNRDTLHQRIMERSQTVQDIMSEIKSKPKGEAAAIKKRMVATIQDEISETTDRCTSDVHEHLLAHVDDARLGTPDRKGDAEKGEGIFDATYLVHKNREIDFHADLESLCRDYEELGFQMDIIGPVTPVLHLPSLLPASS